MIAHIALLRRLPRKIDYLDYLIPEGMLVKRGDLVVIPFRTASVRGVVLFVSEGGETTPLRPITSIESSHWISDVQLSCLEQTATDLVQSVSTMLHALDVRAALRGRLETAIFRPHTIRRSEVTYIQSAVDFIRQHDRCFIECLDFVQAAAIVEAIKKNIPGPHRVFVPTHHDAQFIDGSMTRVGILKLGGGHQTDIVVRSGAAEHASYDRNPRYDVRKMLKQKIVFIDLCPRVADLVQFPSVLTISSDLRARPFIINMADQKKAGFSSLLTNPLLEAISEALQSQKSVLIYYNRKGVGTGVICRACAYQPRCQSCGSVPTVYDEQLVCHHCGTSSAMLTHCPKCLSNKLTSRGVGNQQVEKKLRQLFPGVDVARVEKGSKFVIANEAKQSLGQKPTIILATRYYLDAIFDPFDPPTFGLVADLCGDLGLSEPTYTATEQTLIRLMELRGVASRAKCQFIVQTWDAPMMSKMLNDHVGFLEEEKKTRQVASLPPFGTIYRLSTRGKTTISDVKKQLSAQLVGLRMREHSERNKPILELYVQPGMIGNLRSALKQLKDDVIIEVL
ncbi:MAG: hypothetical protein AAB429_02970 [Patescibacteria group bacterium]